MSKWEEEEIAGNWTKGDPKSSMYFSVSYYLFSLAFPQMSGPVLRPLSHLILPTSEVTCLNI